MNKGSYLGGHTIYIAPDRSAHLTKRMFKHLRQQEEDRQRRLSLFRSSDSSTVEPEPVVPQYRGKQSTLPSRIETAVKRVRYVHDRPEKGKTKAERELKLVKSLYDEVRQLTAMAPYATLAELLSALGVGERERGKAGDGAESRGQSEAERQPGLDDMVGLFLEVALPWVPLATRLIWTNAACRAYRGNMRVKAFGRQVQRVGGLVAFAGRPKV